MFNNDEFDGSNDNCTKLCSVYLGVFRVCCEVLYNAMLFSVVQCRK